MEMFWYQEHFQTQLTLFSAAQLPHAERAECLGGVQNPIGTLNKELFLSPQKLYYKE